MSIMGDARKRAHREQAGRNRAPPRKPPPQKDNPEPPPAVETFTAADLMKMELPEPQYAVDGVIQQGFNILAGKPKLGKSWMALNIAIAVSTGGCAFGSIVVEQGDVLYLALEDTKRRLQDRLNKLLRSQDAAAPERLTLATHWPRQDKGGLAAVEHWLTERKGARLVIVDTWPRYKPRTLVRGGNDYETDYAHAGELKAVADKAGVSTLALAHCRKMGAADPVEEIMGTMGLSGAADGLLVLRRERGQHDAALHITGRDLDDRELALKWDAGFALWSILGDADEHRLSKERAEVVALLRKAGRPMKTPEIIPLLEGRRAGTVRKMLWEMATAGQIQSLGSGYFTLASNSGNTPHSGNSGNTGNSLPRLLVTAVTDDPQDGNTPGDADDDTQTTFPE